MIKFYLRILLLILFIFACVGIIEKEPWEQILYYRNYNLSFANILTSPLPHLTRYLIVYPSYFLNEITNIEINKIYTLYVLTCYYYTSIIWQKICHIKKTPRLETAIKCTLPLGLFLITNGRFSFIILGLSILMLNAIKKEEYSKFSYSQNFIGLFLVTVSSGAALNGFIFFFLNNISNFYSQIKSFFLPILRGKIVIKRVFILFSIILIIIFTFTYLVIFINKNILYYGGFNLIGLFSILGHGTGLIFNPQRASQDCGDAEDLICSTANLINNNYTINLLFVFSAFIFMIFIFIYLRKNKQINLCTKNGILSSILTGIVGITALLSILFITPAIPIRDLKLKSKILKRL